MKNNIRTILLMILVCPSLCAQQAVQATCEILPVLRFPSSSGVSYLIERSFDLSAYTTVATIVADSEITTWVPESNLGPNCFFRVSKVPEPEVPTVDISVTVSSSRLFPSLGESPFDYSVGDNLTFKVFADTIVIDGVIYNYTLHSNNETSTSYSRQYLLTGGNLDPDSGALALISVSRVYSQATGSFSLNYRSTIVSGTF